MSQKVIISLLIVLLTVGGFYYLSKAEGKFCGGLAANLPENKCPFAFICQSEDLYPDASGKCTNLIKSFFNKK